MNRIDILATHSTPVKSECRILPVFGVYINEGCFEIRHRYAKEAIVVKPQKLSRAICIGLKLLMVVLLYQPLAVHAYSVGGTVSGLPNNGGALILTLNTGLDEVRIWKNGTFVFPVRLFNGMRYEVSWKNTEMVPTQTCMITNGSGTINGADVDDVQVTCLKPLASNPHCNLGAGEFHVLIMDAVVNSGVTETCQPRGWVRVAGDSLVNDNATLILDAENVSIRGVFRVAAGGQLRIRRRGFLNDTRITECGNDSIPLQACPVSGYPGQDGEFGRDLTHSDPADGRSGFSFTKLDADGNFLPDSAASWSCVKDNVTGLVWEVKTNDVGIHYKTRTYRWGGITARGSGYGIYYDDWNELVNGSNDERLCGFDDWRVPTTTELHGILDLGVGSQTTPAIDRAYFPNTINAGYWAASPSAWDSSWGAWGVSFKYGTTFDDAARDSDRYVRLVRSGQ